MYRIQLESHGNSENSQSLVNVFPKKYKILQCFTELNIVESKPMRPNSEGKFRSNRVNPSDIIYITVDFSYMNLQ